MHFTIYLHINPTLELWELPHLTHAANDMFPWNKSYSEPFKIFWLFPNIGFHRASTSKMYEIQISFTTLVSSMLFPDTWGEAPVPSSMLFPDSWGAHHYFRPNDMNFEFRTFLRLRPYEYLYWECTISWYKIYCFIILFHNLKLHLTHDDRGGVINIK